MSGHSNPSNTNASRLVALGTGHGSFTGRAAMLVDGMLAAYLEHPRSFLLLRIGPILSQHPELYDAIVDQIRLDLTNWRHGYESLLAARQVHLRPGWTVERIGMVMTAMLDGFLLRSRIQPEEMAACRWQDAGLLAEA